MKIPTPPPDWEPLQDMLRKSPEKMISSLKAASSCTDAYHDWDYYRHHQPPEGLTSEQWWFGVRHAREASRRATPFTLVGGQPLTYNLPDELLELVEWISANARGIVSGEDGSVSPQTGKQYLFSSVYEEAIRSSQLEGATTSRRVAHEMLQTGRKPNNLSERMIVNNYATMKELSSLKNEELCPELICEMHRMLVHDTLENPAEAGKIQEPGEERVRIYGDETDKQILHTPPPAEELRARMQILCDFANNKTKTSISDSKRAPYFPDLLRAITVHFMVGHDHYFVDGNGRLARALFYWMALRDGFFLMEYISISRLLREAPAQYARAYLLTEQDGGDFTYFFLHQARIIKRSIEDLNRYLDQHSKKLNSLQTKLRDTDLKMRQINLLEDLLRDAYSEVTIRSYADNYRVAWETARRDLGDLEGRGYLHRQKRGRAFVWVLAPSFSSTHAR